MLKRLGAVVAALTVVALPLAGTASAAPSALDTAILATTPAFYYPLTATAGDTSGNGAPALTVAAVNDEGATGTSGVTYGASGANLGGLSYLTGGPAPAATAYSVGAWFSVSPNVTGFRTILRSQGWTLHVSNDNAIGWVDHTGNGGIFGATLGTGQHQIVAVGTPNADPSKPGALQLYLDGALVRTFTTLEPLVPDGLSVGSFPVQAGFNALHGTVSHVAGWTRALTGSEVATMYAAGTPAIAASQGSSISCRASWHQHHHWAHRCRGHRHLAWR